MEMEVGAAKLFDVPGTNRPLNEISLSAGEVAKFWSRVSRQGLDDCWPWAAGAAGSGYGQMAVATVGGRVFLSASRIAWFLAHGRQPLGFVCHSCDNPICVNPRHLWLGDAASNIRDMVRKGRKRTSLPHSLPYKGEGSCGRGHEYTPENTYVFGRVRACRACRLLATNRYRARKALARRAEQAPA